VGAHSPTASNNSAPNDAGPKPTSPKPSAATPAKSPATKTDASPHHSTPSARIAETLDTSLDYLVFDHTPRRPLHTPTTGIEDHLAAIANLNTEDRNTITNTIDALTTRQQPRTITNETPAASAAD
jgi:hypothetical protein